MKKISLLVFFLTTLFVFTSAQRTITGTVTNAENGLPLSNVSVSVISTGQGTNTNEAGKYTITTTAPDAILQFSRIGYEDALVQVDTSDIIDVALQISAKSLETVVITGYTAQTRRQATGSISRVSGDQLKSQPVGSFDQMLQGAAPGVLVQSTSGQPGAAGSVNIRGKGSILGVTEPLYIMDGIQISASDFQSINPADFETYNVLKDAVATAQYGSRGANGVIVVTTKRGTSKKTKINYDVQYGTAELPYNRLELMNSAEKIEYELNYNRPTGKNPLNWSGSEADSLSKIDPDLLQKALFRKGSTVQHQLSLTGGNEKTRVFASASIFNQQGIVITTGLRRVTGRVNLDHSFGNFKMAVNTYIGSSSMSNTSENNSFIGAPLNAVRWANPYVTPYLPDGSYNESDLIYQGLPNAVKELQLNYTNIKQLKLIGSINIEYRFPTIKGLSLRSTGGVDFAQNITTEYYDKNTYQGRQKTGSKGSFEQSIGGTTRYTITNSVNYSKQKGDNKFNISLFNEIIRRNIDRFGYEGYGMIGPFKNAAGITAGTISNGFIPVVSGSETQNAILSFFAIGDYSYKDKYFLNATIRRDGSSRLATNKAWTTFGGIGAGWIISAEEFMSNSNFFDMLKLRASYGSSANQSSGDDYEAIEQLGPTLYSGNSGLTLSNLAKNNLTWEVRSSLNIGLDFELLKNRLNGTIEVYNAVTKGLFLNRQLSHTSGISSILTNLGKLQNQGIELSLNIGVIKNPQFHWNIGGNFTYNKNKILDLGDSNENIEGTSINRVGESANSAFLVRYAGVDPSTGNALYYNKEGEVTNKYNPNDKVIIGRYDPPCFGGINTSLGIKNIELSLLFTYSFGNKIYNADRANVENPAYNTSNLSKDLLKEWRKPGDITDIPSPFNSFQTNTTRFLEDGKYIRLRNVTLAYTLPVAPLRRLKINSARFFIQGQNLFTWTKVRGYDPEVPDGMLRGSQYPALKIITVGLNIDL